MKNIQKLLLTLFAVLLAAGLSGCSRDPNVRKQKYLESGNRYLAKAQYREAVIQFSNALQVDPRFVPAHYQLAQAYIDLGAWSSAYTELLRTVDLQPDHLQAHIEIGNLFLGAHQIDRAREQADIVLKKDANFADGHSLLASILAVSNDMPGALKEIQRAIALSPNHPAYFEKLAVFQAGNPASASDAEASLKRAIELDPKSNHARLTLGRLYMSQKRWPEAEKQFRDAIATEPKSTGPRVALATFFMAQKQTDKAEQCLRDASQELSSSNDGRRLLADYYVASGQMDKAIGEFGRLAKAYPKDAPLKKAYVQLLIDAKREKEAEPVVAELQKANPKDLETAMFRGIILREQGNVGEALTLLQEAVKDNPDNAFARYQLGLTAMSKGDTNLAKEQWREAVRLAPGMVKAEKALADVAVLTGDMQLLSDTADRVIKLSPGFADAYVWRATVESSRKQPELAEADLKKCIELAPQAAIGYEALGRWRVLQKKYGEAENLLNQALDRNPGSAESLRDLALTYMAQKQRDKAIARVQAQIEKVPNSSADYALLASLQFDPKDLGPAEASVLKAIQLDSQNAQAMTLFTRIEVMRGATDKAIAVLQDWIKRRPNDAGAYVVVGSLEESRNNVQAAEQDYQKALQIQPDQPVAANNLAFLMLNNGQDTDMALTLAQTARRGMPQSPASADTLAWAYYHKGSFALARDLLLEATKANDANPDFHLHLGLVYQKLSNANDAASQLKKVISLSPNSPQAEQARKALGQMG